MIISRAALFVSALLLRLHHRHHVVNRGVVSAHGGELREAAVLVADWLSNCESCSYFLFLVVEKMRVLIAAVTVWLAAMGH